MQGTSTAYYRLLVFALLIVSLCLPGTQSPTAGTPVSLGELVSQLKSDPRGPYKRIAWFCPDGRVQPANQPCDEPGGIQHALPKDVVVRAREEHGVYLGQILAGTDFDSFLDAENEFSRAKQYALEKFLRAVDDGWIMRRGRYYRGATQAEDESGWGLAFLNWLLAKDDIIRSHFFFARQMARDLPHRDVTDRAVQIRALSKALADSVSAFKNIRVKIHSRPDSTDIGEVERFRQRHQGKLTPQLGTLLETLAADLRVTYGAVPVAGLARYLSRIPTGPVTHQLEVMIDAHMKTIEEGGPAARELAIAISDLLWTIRERLSSAKTGTTRLHLIDLSLDLESLLFRTISGWQPKTVGELVEKNFVLARAAAGCGFLEVWEWLEVRGTIAPEPDDRQSMTRFSAKADASSRAVDWGAAMVRSTYLPVVERFATFEPLARGFTDDRIRSSVLLAFGETAGQLSRVLSRYSSAPHDVFDIEGKVRIRGLNPGLAVGELEVVHGIAEAVDFLPDKIYVLRFPPADLQPVAGLISVSEGNIVSHVQLLARNLGIPNATIAPEDFERLMAYSGVRVFYAVSAKGRVIVKKASDMTPDELALLENEVGDTSAKISVPTDRIDLTRTECVDLKSLRAGDSGSVCGPKAANLGELSFHFPDKVAPGVVVPFGVFRKHMDQLMSPDGTTYWDFLTDTFEEASKRRERGDKGEELYTEARLVQLQAAIRAMPLLPDFENDLRRSFARVFAGSVGTVPVFIRSDTNMEDLDDFTGAGLNLTVPNVVTVTAIWRSIREVWASPFTRRSYRWRQRFLENPIHVYPSVLLQRSVDVEKSGVMITHGLDVTGSDDIVIAFNRGVGGAVGGQAAETVLLRHDGIDVLLSPARETVFTHLPKSGGVARGVASFETPIVTRAERGALRRAAREILTQMRSSGLQGALDIELGFLDGDIWLFQVRPFVENERARASAYLQALDPVQTEDIRVAMDERFDGE